LEKLGNMSGESRKSSKAQLALAIGQGVSIAAWARDNEVATPTAFRWARDPLVRKAVESYRRRTIDQAIGRMTTQTTRAADIIIRIANEAESDSVRLRAARAIFSDMMAVSDHSELELRMTEIEKEIEKRNGDKNGAVASWSPTTYGQGTTPAAMVPVTSIPSGAG
jgi:hypothetical protein